MKKWPTAGTKKGRHLVDETRQEILFALGTVREERAEGGDGLAARVVHGVFEEVVQRHHHLAVPVLELTFEGPQRQQPDRKGPSYSLKLVSCWSMLFQGVLEISILFHGLRSSCVRASTGDIKDKTDLERSLAGTS